MVNRWLGRDGARLVAAGRVALGVGMIVRPDLLPKLLGVDSGTATRMSWLGRMFGAREVALGAGLLAAGPDREGEWLLGSAFCDAVDAVAFGEAARRGVVRPAFGGVFAVTATTAAGTEVAAWLAGRE